MTVKSGLAKLTLSLICILYSAHSRANNDVQLPGLGGAGRGILTAEQEYRLGQQWVSMFRARVATTRDPFVQTYVENLVNRIATYSDLVDKRLEVVVALNPTLNAFAVPGGIVGVHTGLFNYTNTEEQFSSVIAHELAHLSQKHFLRTLEKQQAMSLPTLAAYIAGIIIAASGGGDAGLGVIAASQASAIDAQLRFSRKMEQEADRVGMAIMARAQIDPHAMPDMFEQMLDSKRFNKIPKEYQFMMTHPLTESRISDAKQRAQQYPRQYIQPSLDYEIAKIRAWYAENRTDTMANKKNIAAFKAHLRGTPPKGMQYSENAARYGLALTLMENKQLNEAKSEIDTLRKKLPNNVAFALLEADWYFLKDQKDTSISLIENVLKKHPNHHAINQRYAELLMKAGRHRESVRVLEAHVKRRPKDDYLWYLLAETYGLAGKIFEVHTARAEYYLLKGLFEKAETQLTNALLIAGDNKHTRAQVEQKLRMTRKLLSERK